eukprot:TRINITY_DN1469_c0_g1_i9.p1 TRINITY_DN1469_c0_g1~~TRINITY_DN1469_c0_g1_i9.p1  ORF type:complete len:409 (-),score=67.20 TRINITY_DN1469_c0_g1_i9:839-2065(-)
MSVFGQLRAHPLLNALVFGECILNDGVAIILYNTLVSFYGQPLVWTSQFIFSIIGQFLLNTFGSLAIGVILALIASKVTQKIDMFPVIELILVLLCAMLSYLLTDFLELSGVTAIFFFGSAAKHYLWFNLSKPAREFTDTFFRTLKDLAEISIFTLLGVQIFMFDWKYYNWPMIGMTIFACLASRLFIVPFSLFLNFFRSPENKITFKMQLIMWWAGLRGAVAYSLAVGIQSYQSFSHSNLTETDLVGGEEMEQLAYEEMVTTTHSIVIFTILCLGCTTAPLLKKVELAGDHVKNVRENLKKDYLQAKSHSKWTLFDARWLIPFFSKLEGREKKLDKMVVKESPNAPNFVPDYILEMAQSNLAESQQAKSPSTESEEEREQDSHGPANTRSENSLADDESSNSSTVSS